MPTLLTTEQFIYRARLKHGTLYDYSKVVYIDSKTKVIIICKIHGDFLQKPNNHLNGQKCGDCAPNKKKDTETFVEKAIVVHGDVYDYSKVIYVLSKEKVIIICYIHGDFEQRPNGHLAGDGCPDCAGNKHKDTERFIRDAQAKHGIRYDYSKVDYHNWQVKVIIICKIHGEFTIRPCNHISGQGCMQCGGKAPLTTETFIIKADKVHENYYDYSKTIYVDSKSEVIIICKEHGEFPQTPNSHLKGHGCSKCSPVALKTTEYFIERATATHGTTYDYSLVDYKGKAIKVKIICKVHGMFEQYPYNHYAGSGCQKCFAQYSKVAIEWLEYVMLRDRVHIIHSKNGGEFTIPGTKYHVDGYAPGLKKVYEFLGDFWHGNLQRYTRDFVNRRNKETMGVLHDRTMARLDKIRSLGYTVEFIWETDWKNQVKEHNNRPVLPSPLGQPSLQLVKKKDLPTVPTSPLTPIIP